MLADVGFAGATLVTLAAGHVHLRRNKVTLFDCSHVLARGDHVSTEFVSWNQRRLDSVLGPLVPVVYVQVGATDRGHLHFYKNVVRTNLGDGHLAHVSSGRGLRFYDGKHGLRHSAS